MGSAETDIPLFPAPRFQPSPLGIPALVARTGKNWIYAGSGRACLYNILKVQKPGTCIALPAYICRSVLAPIRKLGLSPIYYDIDLDDLNPSVAMLERLVTKRKIGAAVFPSLYGLPADCIEAQDLCRASGVMMVDDAAQSYGASLNGQNIGTFGDAGFIAFSPGKATAAHGGGLYWTRNSSGNPSQKLSIRHPLLLWSFKHSRLDGAERGPFHKPAKTLFGLLKRIPGWHDAPSVSDNAFLGGVLKALDSGAFSFREESFRRAETSARKWTGARLIRPVRGQAHPHKIVLAADTATRARTLSLALTAAGIAHGHGYPPLSVENVPNTMALVGRIIELPIVQDHTRMERMFSVIEVS